MTIDGTTLTSYDCEFEYDIDVDDDFLIIIFPGGIYVEGGIEIDVEDPEDPWSSLEIEGPHRYALRRDGKIKRDDTKFISLPWIEGTAWLDFAVSDGHTYAIRSDGVLAVDDDVVASFPSFGFRFRRVVRDGPRVYSLRSDGSVFRDAEPTPAIQFDGGLGPWGGDDGYTLGSTWIALAVDPVGDWIYGLRSDGVIQRAPRSFPGLGTVDGLPVATLPFDVFTQPLASQIYVDLEVLPDGTWIALAGDGRVYSANNTLLAEDDFPGTPTTSGLAYTELAVHDDRYYAMRADGAVYIDGSNAPVYELQGAGYGSLAFGEEPPVLGEEDAKAPKVTLLTTKTVTGTPLRIPVVVADQDTCDAELVVTARDPLPPGATFDAATRSLVWDSPVVGEHLFKFQVDDGTQIVKATYTLKVKDPDPDPAKNNAPFLPIVEAPVAVADGTWTFPVIVDDKDGDPLTVTVDTAKYPFTAGATYDPATGLFTWTPTSDDEGTVEVKFRVSDGKADTVKLIIPLKVKANLAF